MKLVTEKDELMRRYLLDEMSDEEQTGIEERFLEDDNFFEEIAAVEDELYYDYKEGNLSATDKIAFEKKFLATSADRQKADFKEAFLRATKEITVEKTAPSLWQSITALFDLSNSSFRLGTAAASILLLFMLGFWILYNSNKKLDDVAVDVPETINTQTPTPTPVDEKIIEEKQSEVVDLEKKIAEEKQKAEQDVNKIREIEKQKEKIQKEIEINRKKEVKPPTPQKTFIALILSPGLVRGSSSVSKIKLTPELKNINLILPIKKDFQSEEFKIVVRNIDSGAIISSSTARTGKKNMVSLAVSTKSLKRGAYEVVLITADNEELDSYYFNVDK